MVQRYFCANNEHQARKALLWSGVVVFLQFVLFLLIGTMLYVYYTQHAPGEIASFMQDGRLQADRIFPYYIVRHLPPGIVGLVLAAIFAASLSKRVVDEVLGIASFTNGVILGVFFLGTFTTVGQRSAFAGILGGSAIMLGIKLGTEVSWQWYVLIGSVATFAIGWIAARVLADRSTTASALRP
jgi:Na+/proline symporter